jgi:glycosyltransferase involved in cell wall biosynthesis
LVLKTQPDDRPLKANPKIVACIPAYNEERTIASIVIRAMKYADEVIVCDDGSTDMTAEIAERVGATVLKHERNLGKGEALRTLFRTALKSGCDVVVTLDSDGQHNPEEIPILVKPILEREADMVIGSRFVKGASTDIPFYRLIGTRIINALSGKKVKDVQNGFRAFSTKAARILLECESKGYGVEQEQVALAIENNLSIVEVPITVRYRGLEKTSKKGPVAHGLELVSDALRLVVEERPLLLLGVPGIVLCTIAIGLSTLLMWYFNTTRYFSVPIALIILGASFTGIMLIIAALTLYALNRMVRKILKHNTSPE